MRLAEAFRRNLKCLIAEHDVNVKEMTEALHISRTRMLTATDFLTGIFADMMEG